MEKLNLSSPWIIYERKLEALFAKDPEVHISFDDTRINTKVITLRVDNQKKADALAVLLPVTKEFGGTTVEINIVPANNNRLIDIFRDAFDGNPALVEIHEAENAFDFNYAIFAKEVVQYQADDLSSFYRVQSSLYEDIAEDVLDEKSRVGMSFCTAIE